MITTIPSASRGVGKIGWLDSKHTFSFGRYYNPEMMGFGPLRVINDDIVAPGRGFGTHPHDNMEIFSYIVSGALEHKDTIGGAGGHAVLRRGDVQAMSAGTGLAHSEMNPSATEPVRLLQIWIEPDRQEHAPRHAERRFDDVAKRNRLVVMASPDGAEGSLPIHQDARILATVLDSGAAVTHALASGRAAWVQVAIGAVTVNGTPLGPGDGAAITDEQALKIAATEPAEVLVFDLPHA